MEKTKNTIKESIVLAYAKTPERLDVIKRFEIRRRNVDREDFENAFESMKPASTGDMVKQYEEWNDRFGAL